MPVYFSPELNRNMMRDNIWTPMLEELLKETSKNEVRDRDGLPALDKFIEKNLAKMIAQKLF
jgi:hypothetical protein